MSISAKIRKENAKASSWQIPLEPKRLIKIASLVPRFKKLIGITRDNIKRDIINMKYINGQYTFIAAANTKYLMQVKINADSDVKLRINLFRESSSERLQGVPSPSLYN